jgi:hypothetical protein
MCPAMCAAPGDNGPRDCQGRVGLNGIAPANIQLAGQRIPAVRVVQTLDHGCIKQGRENATVHNSPIALMGRAKLCVADGPASVDFKFQVEPAFMNRSARKALIMKEHLATPEDIP